MNLMTTPCAALGILLVLAGCTVSKLETGYEPDKLGSTQAQRKGYYASPFTPEAAAARSDRDVEMEMRRPRPGY